MSQITNGVYSVLSHPRIYDAAQNFMGAKRARRDFVNNFIRPDANSLVLDIGCGTAEILPYLPRGTKYWGYDVSHEYIEAAKRRFGNRGHFQCGQLNQYLIDQLPKFHTVLVIGVLHHLDDDTATELITLASKALMKGGRLVTIDPCFSPKQNIIARYLISRDRGQNVRTAEGYSALVSQAFPQAFGTLRHRNWIPYTHWIMECVK